MTTKTSFSLALAAATTLAFACSSEPAGDDGGGTGGTSTTGGAGPVGGNSGMGGTSTTGGSGPAGSSSGGTATGGTATGGTATGGTATGGSAGAGASSGGTTGGGGSGMSGDGGVAGSAGGGQTGGAGGRAGAGGAGGRAGAGGAGGRAGGGGMGGRAGGGGAGGTGTGGGGGAMASGGCGKSTTQTLGRWVESMVMSGNANRAYSTYLPTGYDPMRAYPVLVLLHGCGSGTNNPPMEQQTKTDAILVRGTGSASGTCWDSSANGADVVFFDAMLADTQARFCTDTKRVFIVGYSSGSWLVDQLACIRAGVVRAGATIAGGNPGVRNCTGPFAQMFVHDQNDTSNAISGSISARDRLLTQNHCTMTTMPQDPSPCVRYQGCDPGYPVVWCATSGQNHNRQDSLTAPAFWKFFQEF